MKKLIVLASAIFISVFATAQKIDKDKAQWLLSSVSEKINGVYIPINIDDAMFVLDTLSNGEVKSVAKESSSESDFAIRAHFGLGLWIRNNWGLWRGSRLSVYFNDMNIFHPDDMSGRILRSYYRYVNGQNLDIENKKERYTGKSVKPKKSFKEKWERIKFRIRYRIKHRHGKELRRNKLYAKNELRRNGLLKGHHVLFAHPYGYSSQEEKNLYDKGICAKGIVKRFKIVGRTAFYEVELLEAQYPDGIIIYDGNIWENKEYIRKSSSIADDKNIFYMKPGERYWFLLDVDSSVFWESEKCLYDEEADCL